MAFDGDEDPMEKLLDNAIWEHVWAELDRELENHIREEMQPVVPRRIQHRRTINWNHIATHNWLFADYFADEPLSVESFHR